jgi:predicted ATPase
VVGPIRTPDQRLRVFISSTLAELADERRAARSAVEQLRLIPVMFELGARPHPPRALYRSYLEQSDVFVGIYWERYGWTAPDMEISGLEDELLLSSGMPRLVYVKRPAPGMEPRLADMLAGLEQADAVSYRPFGGADELRDLLVDDLAILLTERFAGGRDVTPSPSQPLHNIPAQMSAFIGRDAELRDVRGLIGVADIRLVTLSGPAGTGKTRLAIRAALEEAGGFAEGVWFVDLSAERDADGAFAAVARVLGVVVASGTRPLDALEQALRDRRLLLVLDNFEQVMSAAVGVVDLLERCPAVTVLVTSREALRVRGEHVISVPPLSLPDRSDEESVRASEAVRLFVDRAVAVHPGFQLDADNVEAVAAICQLLDGLPLAIELAAARSRLFDVNDLRVRLATQLDVLGGGARDLPKRQQTLRDAVNWSYDLLSEDERQMFRLFSAFSGARLCDVDETARRLSEFDLIDVIEALGSLVDKSLVRASPAWDGGPRFSMLRTIRVFATERLDADEEFAAAVRLAHATQYSEVAARLQEPISEARQAVLLSLSDELGNMRSAWDEWVGRQDVARLNALIAPLWGYYDARGDYRSAIELGWKLLECLGTTPDSPERRRDEFAVRMSVARTELALQGYTAEAERLICHALEQAEVAGDDRRRFPGLRSLGHVHMMRTDFDQTAIVADEVMAIAEEQHDPELLTEAHILAGMSAGWNFDFPSALEHYGKAVAYADAAPKGHVDFRVGPHPVVVANGVSALTQWFVGLPTTAAASMQRSLDLAAELDHPYSMAFALHHAGLLDLWRVDLDNLAPRAAALRTLAEAHDYPMWRALGLILGGVAEIGTGDVDTGMSKVEAGFELYRSLATPPVFWPALLMIHASALAGAGRTTDALDVIREAEATLHSGDPVEADLLVVHSDVLLAVDAPDPSAVEAMLERAVAIARPRGAHAAQLRALTRLAVLRRGTAGENEARQALREVYEGLTEGRDLPHLVAAREALEM